MITYIDTPQDADRARAELEDAWNTLHNEAAKSWHQTKQMGYKEASLHTENVRAALVIVEQLEALLIGWQDRPCRTPDQCAHMIRADDQCPTAAMPHEEKCDDHMAGESRWHEGHEVDDCCPVHCDGAEHTVDGEPVEEMKAA